MPDWLFLFCCYAILVGSLAVALWVFVRDIATQLRDFRAWWRERHRP